MDFTLIPDSIKKILIEEKIPLTDEQFLIIAGYLAQQQLMIEMFGLEHTLNLLCINTQDKGK